MIRTIDANKLEKRICEKCNYNPNSKITLSEIADIIHLLRNEDYLETQINCMTCTFYDKESWEEPCKHCRHNFGDAWRPKITE